MDKVEALKIGRETGCELIDSDGDRFRWVESLQWFGWVNEDGKLGGGEVAYDVIQEPVIRYTPPKPKLRPLNAEEMEDLVGQMIWHDGCKRMVLSAYDNGAYLCLNGRLVPMDSERLLKFASYDKAGEKPIGAVE